MMKKGVAWLGLVSSLSVSACAERPPSPPVPRPAPESAAADPSDTVMASAAPAPQAAGKPAPRVSVTAPPDYEQADLDPDNDFVVSPPPPLDDCAARLERANISFVPATLPLRKEKTAGRQGRVEIVSCGAEQVVAYTGGPARIKYNGAPTLTCRMALALARFEELAQAQARRYFGQRIVRIRHLGTYSCRKMVRFDFVSEHSYANAIDIGELELEGGQHINVADNFGALAEPPESREAEFLRSLARRAFDERLFSTVLTPFWDNLHHDHFHLDLARYRVDGTRPAE